MKLLTLLSLLFLSACTITLQVPAQVAAKPEVDISQWHKSVGEVYVKAAKVDGGLAGTAFAISKDLLMTAGHVCVGTIEYQASGDLGENIQLITMKDGIKQYIDGVEILEVDEPHDICLLKKSGHGLIPLKFLRDYDNLKFRDKVWVVGAPRGMLISEQEGRVMDTSMDQKFPLKGKLLISSAVAGGNSGSPVLNERGEVVGMLVMGDQVYDHLGVCTNSPDMIRFLQLTGHMKK